MDFRGPRRWCERADHRDQYTREGKHEHSGCVVDSQETRWEAQSDASCHRWENLVVQRNSERDRNEACYEADRGNP